MRRIIFIFLRLAIGIGLLTYLVRAKVIDLHLLPRLLSDWPISAAAIVLLLLDLALMAWRLCWLFRPQGIRLSFIVSLQLTSIGYFFAIFLPGRAGGDVAKMFYASREKSGRRTEIITVLIFDRVLGFFSLLLLPLLSAPLFPTLLSSEPLRIALALVAILAFGIVAVFLLCLFSPAVVRRAMEGPLHFLPGKDLVLRSLGTVAVYRHNPRPLFAAMGISLMDNAAAMSVIALGLLLMSPSSLTPSACVMVPIGVIVNSLPITPGGLGVGEEAFNVLFHIAGLHGGAEALLCWRIWTALVGLIGLIPYLRGFQASLFEVAPSPEPVLTASREI
ncbi:MAG TPA: lysylphosphatidylglycerol synthase transmembrane domain-containing protein [Silvibacterium sp.]|nr:lysylphosphatidylglycerol synthase transmembrane domain-containing protein [Silvibacterium sp.]